MRGRALLVTCALVFMSSVACGLLGDGEAALKKQEAFADRTCACPDVACLKKVQEAQARWIEDHGDELVAAGMADGDRLQASVDKTARCAERIARTQANEVTGGSSGKAGKRGKKGKRKGR